MISADPYDIAWHWPCYSIAFDGETWTAWRKGDPEAVLYARTEAQLRDLIRADYVEWKLAPL